MKINSTDFGRLDGLYDGLLALTPRAREMLADPSRAEEAQREYAEVGFVTVADVLPAAAWTELATLLLPILSVVAEPVTMRHRPESGTVLSDGSCFRRVDPHCIRVPETRATMALLLDKLGLSSLGAMLATELTPLVRAVAGPLCYQHNYFYLYEEGDYISVHNDHQVGDRVDVQFPVSLDTVGGIRILDGGLLRMRYDRAGAMNILGPRVWHDVPPLLRANHKRAPHRFNMGFRFVPETVSPQVSTPVAP